MMKELKNIEDFDMKIAYLIIFIIGIIIVIIYIRNRIKRDDNTAFYNRYKSYMNSMEERKRQQEFLKKNEAYYQRLGEEAKKLYGD